MQVAITPKGAIDVKKVDKFGVNMQLRQYKDKNGSINYPELFKIPTDQRIAAMASKDLEGTIKTVTVALTLAFETMNLARPMQAFQILDLAELIVDKANENDKPSFPDLMLFLQRLTTGEYPGLYEGMDIPKFMERWNMYRDERWEEGIRIRDEQHEYYKAMGDNDHHQRYNPRDTSAFGEMMQHYRTKAQINRDEKRERRSYDN